MKFFASTTSALTAASLSFFVTSTTTIFQQHPLLMVHATKVRGYNRGRGGTTTTTTTTGTASGRTLKSKKGDDNGNNNDIFSFGDDFDCGNDQVEQFIQSDTDPIHVMDDIDIKGDIDFTTDQNIADLFVVSSEEKDIIFDCQGHVLNFNVFNNADINDAIKREKNMNSGEGNSIYCSAGAILNPPFNFLLNANTFPYCLSLKKKFDLEKPFYFLVGGRDGSTRHL